MALGAVFRNTIPFASLHHNWVLSEEILIEHGCTVCEIDTLRNLKFIP